MDQRKMIGVQALLQMERFVQQQIKELPPPPLDRTVYHLPSMVITGTPRKPRLVLEAHQRPTRSARGEYTRLLEDIRRDLDASSDPV